MSVAPTRDDRATIDKAISLLSSFSDPGGAGLGVSELARRSGLSKSTAFRVLGMLVRNGVVEKSGPTYQLGSRLHDLGTKVYSPEHERVHEVLTPFLADLYEMTHETVHLAALHGRDVIYLAKLFGHRRVPSPSRVGGRVPAHCTAVGKALLAFSAGAFDSDDDQPLRSLTPWTVADNETLSAQLMRVRLEGVAYDHQEAAPHLACVAVPIFGTNGRPVAAVSVSGPMDSFNPMTQTAPLRRIANAASVALQRARVGSTVSYAIA